ncbi:MAG: quinone-dependent dihydroorotate dehydrogenase [Bdellovibrio sp. CG10_big_fil_rev_8_21_14_0_10_47_8]|nr:MAG: quinone-dependent dihydroorotate dehydrogenase [Bdellovibrio sp. CG10_big_fil_rev_8_21_14_0_10_47_8]
MDAPLWKFLPARLAHSLAPWGLKYFADKMPEDTPAWRSFTWKGLHFANRLGIAGGLDKNASHLTLWQRLGVGFIEIGTVTPYAQSANRGKILDRDWDQKNLWNKMGFPNHGSDEIYFNILNEKSSLKVPIFVNIGKNRSRPNDEAELDYQYLADRFSKAADAFVINVSSPNTQGLRDLQSEETLGRLVSVVQQRAAGKPVLVKLSPDMTEEALHASIDTALRYGAEGFVLTNTTLSRPPNCTFPKEGGLSGQSLADLSRKNLKSAISHLGSRRKDLLLVSVGGVLCPEDVEERLALGADLVQTYSGLIFYGPRFFRDTAKRINA